MGKGEDRWLIVLLVTSCGSSEERRGRKYGRGGLIYLALSLFNIYSRLQRNWSWRCMHIETRQFGARVYNI